MRGSDRITFHKLTFTRREKDYVVSYEHTNSHALIDEEGKHIIEDLHTHSIGEVKKKYEEYDVEGFIKELADTGLIYRVNNHVIEPRKHIVDVLSVPKSHAKFFVNPVIVGVILGIISTGIYLLITQPELVPTPQWLFATSTLSILIPVIIFTFFAISFIHELGHHIMMQVLGYSRALAIEHRWHLLRPKADTTKLHALTESAQKDVKIAGVITDLLIFSKALIITAITGHPIAQLVALLAFVHLLGQALVHPAADLHFTKQEKEGCKLCQLFKPKNLFGLASLLIIIFVYTIPATYELIMSVLIAAQNPLTHIDGVISLILITATLSFATAATLYDHKYNTNKAYKSIMVSALTTSLLLTTLLLAFLIVA